MSYEMVPLSKVVADEEQPRKNFDASDMNKLIDSIREYGIRNPIIAEKMPTGMYLLEDGERRYRAAKELNLKEVPVIVTEPKDAMTRLITQFHLQEQHKGWTPTEKAVATLRLAQEMKMDVKQMAKLLAINERTITQYMAFANIIEKTVFEKEEMPLQLAENIYRVKRTAAMIYKGHEEKFTRQIEKDIENAIILRVKRGEINYKGDVSKFGDVAKTNFPAFKELIKNDKKDLEETFSASKAKGYRMAKNVMHGAGHMRSYIAKATAVHSEKHLTAANKTELLKAADEIRSFANSIG
jgi:ParB/RepB/Spo0J family partition protein